MPRIPHDEIFVPNTTTEIFVNSLGNQTQYCITPEPGYVLHDKEWDEKDEEGNIVRERFARGMCSYSINYDFDNVTIGTYEGADGVTYTVNKLGANELFTLPVSAVPTADTYGGGNNHETA